MPSSKLSEYIEVNANFKTSVNLYLSLNKIDKVNAFIPTSSSLKVLESYLDAIIQKKNAATMLVGPYGKGKSHLFLVLLAIISLPFEDKNNEILFKKILKCKIDFPSHISNSAKDLIEKIQLMWKDPPVWNREVPEFPTPQDYCQQLLKIYKEKNLASENSHP